MDKCKIQEDCVNAPISDTDGLGDHGKAMEDRWFRENEKDLMEAARARNKKEDRSSTTNDGNDKIPCCGGNCCS